MVIFFCAKNNNNITVGRRILVTRNVLRNFLDKSGVCLSYVARETKINRTELSLQLHGHKDLSHEKAQRVKSFIKEYESRWK